MGRNLFGGWQSTSGHSVHEPKREGYDVAQVCMNGHMVNPASQASPEHNKSYCDTCGKKTITACQSCNTPIRGLFWGTYSASEPAPPNHCHQCGQPFPWTEAKQKAALELFAELLDLEQEQRDELARDLEAIAVDQPRTQVAALRLKRLIGKVGKEAAGMVRDIIVGIASDVAVKAIYPNQK